MKKLLCSMSVLLTLGVITYTGIFAADIQKIANLGKQLSGTTPLPPMISYFNFNNLPKGVAFKITTKGNDVTDYMNNSSVTYYLKLKQGTYLITLNDQLKTTPCSFAINPVVVPTGYALTMQAVNSNSGYTCTLGKIGNWPNFLTIHKTN